MKHAAGVTVWSAGQGTRRGRKWRAQASPQAHRPVCGRCRRLLPAGRARPDGTPGPGRRWFSRGPLPVPALAASLYGLPVAMFFPSSTSTERKLRGGRDCSRTPQAVERRPPRRTTDALNAAPTERTAQVQLTLETVCTLPRPGTAKRRAFILCGGPCTGGERACGSQRREARSPAGPRGRELTRASAWTGPGDFAPRARP